MTAKYNPFTETGRTEIQSFVYDNKKNVLTVLIVAMVINIFVIIFIYMNYGYSPAPTSPYRILI